MLPPLAKECCLIPETARDFIAYWIENCVHASEADSTVGAEQDVSILTGRCLDAASTLGLSRAALEQEVGNLSAYIGSKLVVVNSLERVRRVSPAKQSKQDIPYASRQSIATRRRGRSSH